MTKHSVKKVALPTNPPVSEANGAKSSVGESNISANPLPAANFASNSGVEQTEVASTTKVEHAEASSAVKVSPEKKMNRFSQEIQTFVDSRLENLKFELQEHCDKLLNGVAGIQSLDVSSSLSTYLKDPIDGLRRKSFVYRESTLTIMLKDDNYATIFNMAVAILIFFGLNTMMSDYLLKGEFFDFSLFTWCFSKFYVFLVYWTIAFCCTFLIIPISNLPRIFSLLFYTILQFAFFSSSFMCIISFKLPPPVALSIVSEQVRFSMKIHSYYRENRHADFSSLFYFLFAPTLIYKPVSHYPRTRKIRFFFLLEKLGEAIGIILYLNFIFRLTLPRFAINSLTSSTVSKSPISLLVSVMSCLGSSISLLILVHFLVLHVVQNLFAEITRFSDRLFYEDWWNSRSWSVYYRKWNGVVYDFIHEYCYNDLIIMLGKRNKNLALLASFGVSIVIHEYIVSLTIGFFYPILSILFGGPGLIFIALTNQQTNRFWNIFMWLMLSLGTSCLFVLYCMEYHERWEHSGFLWDTVYWYDVIVPYSFRDLILKK